MSIVNEINKNPLDFINKLVRGVVYNLIKKQIYKKEIDVDNRTVQYVYDIDTLMDIQYKKYYYPTDKEDEFYEMNKDEYCLAMFRLINFESYGINISDILQRMMINTKDNISFINSVNYKLTKEEINEINYCSYALTMFKEYDVNTKQEKKKKINIHIPKQKFDVILRQYEENIKLNYQDYYRKYIESGKINILEALLYNEQNQSYHTNSRISFYLYYEDYKINNKTKIKKDKYFKYIGFIFFSFLLFMLKLCKHNYITMSTGILLANVDNTKVDKIQSQSHANMIIFQITKNDKVVGIQYEPHGTKDGFSYDTFKISEYFDVINKYSIQCKEIDGDFPEFVIKEKVAVCPIGIQSSNIIGNYDIGYCSIFSLFWYNCFLDIIQNIKRIENKYNINTLSNIDIQLWINYIDHYMTNSKNNIILKHGDTKYDYNILLNVYQSVFKEHYKKYKIFKVVDSYSEYSEMINMYFEDEFIDGVEHITISEFIDMYYDNVLLVLLRKQLKLNNDIIINTSDNRYKMNNIEYYNIFVNYAYNMISYIMSSPYLEKERELLNKYSQKNTFINILKDNKNVKIVKKSKDTEYKTEKDIYDYYLEDYDEMYGNLEYNKEHKEHASEQMNEIEELIYNLPKKYRKKIGEECTTNKDCGNKLVCDEYNQCNINYNKKLIGDECEEDDDCYSEYCDNKICKKYVHNVPNISSDEESD
uniref:Uncharacterized protein n=1 Tax=viral metagenome TaxID=1070528 RepID=A0A6C0I5I5_9ZZZZ